MKEFNCRTRLAWGDGALSALETMGIRRLLLVSDPYFVKTGQAQKVAAAAKAETVEIFDRVEPDPSVELAAAGAAVVRAFCPDVIAALGGGSAIDCAKAMGYFGGCTRFVAIPTTSGSGSEVTDFAVLTHGDTKHPLVDDSLRPEAAILDSDFLQELPAGLIADCGFDVLAHALEALVAEKASPVTDALATDAFCRAFSNLEASFYGNKMVRLDIHLASAMAGMAFSGAGLGVCHALAHSLGGRFHIPHGRLNAVLLPVVVAYNETVAGEKYARLARTAGLGGSARTMAVRNLQTGLKRLRSALQLPATLAEAGVDLRQLRREREHILTAALSDPCCAGNPRKPDGQSLGQLLEAVTGRG